MKLYKGQALGPTALVAGDMKQFVWDGHWAGQDWIGWRRSAWTLDLARCLQLLFAGRVRLRIQMMADLYSVINQAQK